jgi:uncharacterized membrane protein YdjX (TVP38/TMEM64 family)
VTFVAVVIGYFCLGGRRLLSFEEISAHRAMLRDWFDQHALLSVAAFMAAYAVAVAFSLPGGVWLTIAGGFFFGVWPATLYVVISATIGACAIFLVARYVAGDLLVRRAGPAIRRMEAGFREGAFNYMLVLRLVPLFPFWLVNLVPAFLHVPFRTYALATLIGIVPGTLVYTLVGDGLGAVFDAGTEPDLGIIFQPEILAPLIGLALLSLAPLLYKWFRRGPPGSQRTD